MEKKVLIIIDVQKAMFIGENKSLYNGKVVLDNIQELIKKAREKSIKIIFNQHTDTEGEYKKGCISWELSKELDVQSIDIIVEKTSWDSFYNTKLLDILHDYEIKELIIAGMQTEFCIDTSIRSAYSHGFLTTLVSDAHSTFDSNVLTGEKIVNHHNSIIDGRFASLIKTKEIKF